MKEFGETRRDNLHKIPIVCQVLRGIVAFEDVQFKKHLPILASLFTDLVLHENAEIRLVLKEVLVRVGKTLLIEQNVPSWISTKQFSSASFLEEHRKLSDIHHKGFSPRRRLSVSADTPPPQRSNVALAHQEDINGLSAQALDKVESRMPEDIESTDTQASESPVDHESVQISRGDEVDEARSGLSSSAEDLVSDLNDSFVEISVNEDDGTVDS